MARQLQNPRLCALGDPHHPDYSPGYEQMLVRGPGVPAPEPPPPKAEPEPIEAPGLLRKAANLATAVMRHVAAGMPTVTPEEAARRLEICGSCEFFDAAKGTCKRCGCHLSTKASWSLEACPVGKWGPIPPVPGEPTAPPT